MILLNKTKAIIILVLIQVVSIIQVLNIGNWYKNEFLKQQEEVLIKQQHNVYNFNDISLKIHKNLINIHKLYAFAINNYLPHDSAIIINKTIEDNFSNIGNNLYKLAMLDTEGKFKNHFDTIMNVRQKNIELYHQFYNSISQSSHKVITDNYFDLINNGIVPYYPEINSLEIEINKNNTQKVIEKRINTRFIKLFNFTTEFLYIPIIALIITSIINIIFVIIILKLKIQN